MEPDEKIKKACNFKTFLMKQDKFHIPPLCTKEMIYSKIDILIESEKESNGTCEMIQEACNFKTFSSMYPPSLCTIDKIALWKESEMESNGTCEKIPEARPLL